MKTTLWRLFPLLLMALVGVVVWQYRGPDGQAASYNLACPDLKQGCGIQLDGRHVRVALQGELKPLQPFQVRVEAPGAGNVEARFSMEGMDMGFNLYALRADKPGVFQASVTLPVCVSGRRDWIMHLTVDGTPLTVPFVTDL
jgi:hypothetical protein